MRDHLTDIATRFREAARDGRCWAYNVGRSQPTLDVVRLMAQLELHTNPTITTYKYLDGKEIRNPGNVWIRVRVSFESFAEAMQKFAESARSLLGPRDA